MIKNITHKFFFAVVMVLVFCSCDDTKQSMTIASKTFIDGEWGRFDYLVSSYSVVEPFTADIVIDLVVEENFPNSYYHPDDNIFPINITVTTPDDAKRSRDFQFKIKDDEGKLRSENVDGHYHFQLPLFDSFNFSTKGDYLFKIENKYSYDPMQGITSLSIECITKK